MLNTRYGCASPLWCRTTCLKKRILWCVSVHQGLVRVCSKPIVLTEVRSFIRFPCFSFISSFIRQQYECLFIYLMDTLTDLIDNNLGNAALTAFELWTRKGRLWSSLMSTPLFPLRTRTKTRCAQPSGRSPQAWTTWACTGACWTATVWRWSLCSLRAQGDAWRMRISGLQWLFYFLFQWLAVTR